MNEASFRGSAQVGWGGRWPFARLVANADTLTLSSLILGTYSFAPSEVVAIEPYGSISTLASAIRIDHNQKNYPKNMIFWCTWGRRSAILRLFSFLAVLLVFCAATATRSFASFQRFVLREGHELSEIVSFLIPLQLISVILLFPLGFALFQQW
ncbi:MAG TPA: hypothetical protein VED45_05430 [Steroidobacteraceae bacterium]|nr:hypothetical protein [Steroidobacteraceae bacterium]